MKKIEGVFPLISFTHNNSSYNIQEVLNEFTKLLYSSKRAMV
jgi:hypothetical protein